MSDLGVAIVTGAGRGIGKAIAIGYAKEGAAVCCAARTLTEIEETVREIEADGGRALAVQTDIADFDSVRHMVQATVDAFGGLDILVANAGGNFGPDNIEHGDMDLWRMTVEINFTGTLYCARAVIPHLKRRGGGKIIVLGSQLGHKGIISEPAYSCAKAAVWMLTRLLAQELYHDKISVNELIPGPVRTPGSSAAQSRPDSVFVIGSEWIKQSEDVVPLALFLAKLPNDGPSAQTFKLNRRDA